MIFANGSATCDSPDGKKTFDLNAGADLVQEGQKCEFSFQCKDKLSCFKGKCVCLEEDESCKKMRKVKRKVNGYKEKKDGRKSKDLKFYN